MLLGTEDPGQIVEAGPRVLGRKTVGGACVAPTVLLSPSQPA